MDTTIIELRVYAGHSIVSVKSDTEKYISI